AETGVTPLWMDDGQEDPLGAGAGSDGHEGGGSERSGNGEVADCRVNQCVVGFMLAGWKVGVANKQADILCCRKEEGGVVRTAGTVL
ncbi:hypothetical protein V490_03539, partial [Pseudogymnoascus sp. VKM F-3557]